MITALAELLFEKRAEADEVALAELVEALRSGNFREIRLGTVHPDTLRRIQEHRKRFRYPDFVVTKHGVGHLYDSRIVKDGYAPEYVADILRNIMNNPDTEFRWSERHGRDAPHPSLVAYRSLAELGKTQRVDFSPIFTHNKRIGITTAYDPPEEELETRVLRSRS